MSTSTSNPASLVWAFIASYEGSTLSTDRADPGNYTPSGKFVGSKFGISAHSYPGVDIPNMTYAGAQAIMVADFWPKVRADDLVASGMAPLALLMVDACWMSGAHVAIVALQQTIGVETDGDFGPQTLAALKNAWIDPEVPKITTFATASEKLLADYAAERVEFEARLNNWAQERDGWTARMMASLVVACHWFASMNTAAPSA
jgi:lysozyme family protein